MVVSTVDIALATSSLSNGCAHRGIHPGDHGSDRKAIWVHFDIEMARNRERRRTRMYDKADWSEVRKHLSARWTADCHPKLRKTSWTPHRTSWKRWSIAVLEQHVPHPRPSPYAKRKEMEKLKTLRDSLSTARDHITTVRSGVENVTEAGGGVKPALQPHMDE
ncbi:hypothetical protein LTR22_027518, partial [Elasticomyces elasticus]